MDLIVDTCELARKFRFVNYVIDTSALVALSGINQLDLLKARCRIVAVPEAVRREVVDQGRGWREAAAAQTEILSGEWLKTVVVRDSPGLRRLRSLLGGGESECLEFAKIERICAILDDQAARKEARSMQVNFFGSLGILAWSKKEGLVQSVRPLVEEMQQNGIFLSERLLKPFFADLGEGP